MTSVEEPPRSAGRVRDAARTRAEILDVATQEFARAGYDGARVDEIAARTRTTKRMIYYYFGGKEQLFTAALERAYGAIREAERQLDVEHLDPVAAIRRLAEVTFDHHERNPDFIRLVSIENIHGAEHIAASGKLDRIGSPALEVIRRILAAGQESELFRADVDAVDLHAVISSFCFFRVANRHTFGVLFGRNLVAPARREHYRTMLGDMVIAYLTADRALG
ncbi:transcriptional regulator, TetR family [Streptomyces sp. 1222.5]|uniref:TetR/AcrR family transcriptional regulator n=1 Tax=unclassified Streptomyces TaxID=2593676 RepID=UPI000897ED6E|nr:MULTISPECIES: TetR/AcrR family transcriptional regulator [unclassified Streptomyces]PKW11176.1 TetR family transcriptional regulator [Streptomyces sp. 5112.2]SEB86048.1 transcriptional regulator, TetR family [Streptomyces sp. 1222.5]